MIPMSRPRMVVDNGEVYYLFRDQNVEAKFPCTIPKTYSLVNGT